MANVRWYFYLCQMQWVPRLFIAMSYDALHHVILRQQFCLIVSCNFACRILDTAVAPISVYSRKFLPFWELLDGYLRVTVILNTLKHLWSLNQRSRSNLTRLPNGLCLSPSYFKKKTTDSNGRQIGVETWFHRLSFCIHAWRW